MGFELHYIIAGIILFILSRVLNLDFEHAEKIPPFRLWRSKKRKIERRHFPRYNTSLRIKYKMGSMRGTSWIKDISRGGAGLFLDRTLEVTAPLAIEVNLPYSSRPIFLKGEIVWQKGSNAGVSFSHASSDDINRIFSYIESKNNVHCR